ncbi:GNAT family N-acetyltransferase [Streptomyces sp. NRRL S-87]|uniref:GNAT family N-acetyltransferase n=1 Tax=Streptomyces sp. NRRL S-87 TaxID=1463920 RepID=UPI0004BE73FE|nr:GNAT family N-acetyltransferase [Streptomyces sp. NRRL S-87]
MHIETYRDGLPGHLRTQVHRLQDEAWPPEGEGTYGHDPLLRPRAMVLVDADGTVLAALDLLFKELRHAGADWRAAGLSTVVTRTAARGRGHGRRLVAAAREALAADGETEVGLFTCDRPLRGFYEGAGWTELPGSVLVGGTPEAPFPSDRPGFDKVTMGGFFTERARAARAGFAHARIGLYPGTVDRLW